MNGRHSKQAFPFRYFKKRYLQNYGKRLDYKQEAGNDQQKRTLEQNDAGTHRPADRQRSRIPHKHLRWIKIKQQKAKQTTRHRHGKICDGIIRTEQDRNGGKQHKYDKRRAGAQAVQAVRQIDGIRRRKEDQNTKRDEYPFQVKRFRIAEKVDNNCVVNIILSGNIKYERKRNQE